MEKSKIGFLAALAAFVVLPTTVSAAETANYTYDALGRVVRVERSGGPSNGEQADYSYDPAGNRSNVTVTGASNGGGSGGNGNGGNGSNTLYVVVPLNGFTLIVIN